jgi:hypothetical protein
MFNVEQRYDISKAAQLIVSLMDYISQGNIEVHEGTPSDKKRSSSRKDKGTLRWFRLLLGVHVSLGFFWSTARIHLSRSIRSSPGSLFRFSRLFEPFQTLLLGRGPD